jgi:hypothetical protein
MCVECSAAAVQREGERQCYRELRKVAAVLLL